MKYFKLNVLLILIFFYQCKNNRDQSTNSKIKSSSISVLRDTATEIGTITKFNQNQNSDLSIKKNCSFIELNLFNYISIKKINNLRDSIYCESFGENSGFINKKFYRYSRNGKFFLKYDSGINILYDSSGNILCKLPLEANNPEFNIETQPLEQEKGLIYIDALSNITKYRCLNENNNKAWSIKLNSKQFLKHFISTQTNELLIVNRNVETGKSNILIYSMIDGKIKHDYLLNILPKGTLYSADYNIISLFDDNQLIIYDGDSNKNYKLNISGFPQSIFIGRSIEGIIGALIIDNKIYQINTINRETSLYQLNISDLLTFGKSVNTMNYFAINYFISNTPKVISNETKIIGGGIFIFDIKNKKWYNLKNNSQSDFTNIYQQDNEILWKNENNIFKINLKNLKN